MKTSKIQEIIKRFKDLCTFHGWKTSEKDYWIETEDGYHNFLWTRNIHPSSFKSITANRKCVVQEGSSYHVVEASYTAWLFSETPSQTLLKTVFENPGFSKTTAIYNLNPALEGEKTIFKLNHTDSPVFQEFENFLKNELKVKLEPIINPEINSEKPEITKLA